MFNARERVFDNYYFSNGSCLHRHNNITAGCRFTWLVQTNVIIHVIHSFQMLHNFNIVWNLFSPWLCMTSRPLWNQLFYLHLFFFRVCGKKLLLAVREKLKLSNKDSDWMRQLQSLDILMYAHLLLSTQTPSSGPTEMYTDELLLQWATTFKI